MRWSWYRAADDAEGTMIQCIQTLMQRRRRQRRAMIIQHELARAGYSATDLKHLALLRATVEPALVVAAPAPEPPDPASPTLADVLPQWESACLPADRGIPQATPLFDEAESLAIHL
jgi:hypothetical protein